MKNLSKFLILLIVFFSFSTWHLAFSIRASDDSPIPPPRVPCYDEGKDPEFESLRPYQASPCGDPPKAEFCGNILTIKETKDVNKTFPADQYNYCPPSIQVNWENGSKSDPKDYWIDLSETEFPIAGNTEEVFNSQDSTETFDDATKVNEYASWYLSGVNNRAEYGENTDDRVVNYSGPVQKLLPSIIQEAQRITSIENASLQITYTDEGGENVEDSLNHNQIVVCSDSNIPIIGNLLNLGKFKVVPCYKGDGSSAKGFLGLDKEIGRLKDWNEDLSFWNSVENTIIDLIAGLLPNVARNVIEDSIGNHWNKRIPPLPWDDGTAQAGEDPVPFASDVLYRKAYNEWKGKTCVLIPVVNFLICFENIFVPNRWADLYQYIPLSNTADKNAKMPIYTITSQPSAGTIMVDKDPRNVLDDGEPVLYYPHTYETKELSELLNKTYIPNICDPESGECEPLKGEVDLKTTEVNMAPECRTIEVRSNEGDNLFPIHEPGDIGVEVYFKVTEIPLSSCQLKTDPVTGEEEWQGHYSGLVTIEVHTDPVKVPWATETWRSTFADSTSTVRRLFPKVEKGAPIECFADIPSETKAVYTPVIGTDQVGVRNTNDTKFDSNDARIYFPHWGSIYDYFLKGIQTALRPKGYGEPIYSGKLCSNIECGELPDLPKASGSCILGGISPKVGDIPQSLKDIIEAASQTYNTPPNLILGIMYGEGLFNPGRFDWTDENVKNWATCEPIPGCSTSGDDNFMGFNGNDWENIIPNIEDDIKKLDPNRETPSQCNLLDAIYGMAWNLHDSADGGGGLPPTCFGIGLSATVPGSCSWSNEQYESAIKVAESGYTDMCFTKEGSCATGGGTDAACPTGGDTCETINNRYLNTSHNGCVWDVAHGN